MLSLMSTLYSLMSTLYSLLSTVTVYCLLSLSTVTVVDVLSDQIPSGELST